MPRNSILTSEQIAEFDRVGVLRLEGLISAGRVRLARAAILRRLETLGLWKDGGWRLSDPRPQWPNAGLGTKAIGQHPEMTALIEEPQLLATVDTLLKGRAFDRTLFKRPQVMFTLPNADTWTVPTSWHADNARLASGESPGVQFFTFLDAVAPRGGGTLVVAGSHRLLNDGQFIRVADITRTLRQQAFFRELFSSGNAEARAGLLNKMGAIGDVALRVMELTGAPGDVYFMDLRMLHTAAPNASDYPRMMATHRFLRADLVDELSQGYGWK